MSTIKSKQINVEWLARQLVERWIREKRSYISMNKINDNDVIDELAISILINEYKGKYIPNVDMHFCGGYSFRNPLGHYETYYTLYCTFETTSKPSIFSRSKDINDLLDEIIRIEYDNIYWKHKELIPDYRELIRTIMHNNQFHKTRYWTITEEPIWTV